LLTFQSHLFMLFSGVAKNSIKMDILNYHKHPIGKFKKEINISSLEIIQL